MSGKNTIITSTHTGDNATRLTYPTVGEALHIARQLAHYSPLNVDTTLTDEMLEDHSNDTWFDALGIQTMKDYRPEDVWLSLIHISEPTRRLRGSRMPSSA